MIETFASDNRRFLVWYESVARITGWILVVLGVIWMFPKTVAIVTRIGHWTALKEEWANGTGIFAFLVFGMVALGISEVIRYVTQEGYRPSWILRCGSAILYIYAACVLLNSILALLLEHSRFVAAAMTWQIVAYVIVVLATLGKVVVLVGLGQLLRRVMPVLEEAKTLV